MAAALVESARAGDKARRKLELDLAAHQGRELYGTTAPDTAGVRRIVRRAKSGNLEEIRAIAQNFLDHRLRQLILQREQVLGIAVIGS